MEALVLGGLLGAGFLVSKFSSGNKMSKAKGYTPEDMRGQMLSQGTVRSEGFLPAQRGPDSQALTQTPKGASAVGFGPELDQMYQTTNGQTYPSEPNPGPYGTALGYATQRPPLAPTQGLPGQFTPQPIASEINIPMVEMRSDGFEESPNYMDTDYVVSPLSGQKIASQDYKHNNMQPFFGGRMKQNMVSSQNQATLDMYNGSGSTQIKKREVENMFETNRAPYGNPYGMEDNTDFFQGRIDAPISRDGERPFEPIHVGASIGERYGLTGKGGFQQLEINEIMRPKDTDQLRVATNPKQTFKTPVVPGASFITTNANDSGEVRKYKPDTFYIDETGERYFTTPADLIKETARPVQVLNFVTRPETSVAYIPAGASQDFGESYVTGSYRSPMAQQYGGAGYRNADMTTYYTKAVGNDMADYGKSSYEVRPNERSETSERVIATNLVPADTGNVIQPFEDIARPTRRAETVGNIRETGTPVRYEGGAPMVTVWDPKDVARTTVKESTIYLDRPGIAGPDSAPARLKVYDPDDIARPTQKQQLSANLSWNGPGVSASPDQMDETFAYNMRLNPNKEPISRGRKPYAGSGQDALFNGNPGKQLSKKLDADYINDRPMALNRPMGGGEGLTAGVGDIGRMEYRVPLKLDVSRERNMYETVAAVDNNPLMQSLKKNAELDDRRLAQMLVGR